METMKNNVTVLCAVLAALLFAACGGEKTDPVPPGHDPVGAGQQVRITHYNLYYCVPAFEGADVRGAIDWGDGAKEPYAADAAHTYRNTMAHEVVVGVEGARTVTFADLTGVDRIDLSRFAADAAEGQ